MPESPPRHSFRDQSSRSSRLVSFLLSLATTTLIAWLMLIMGVVHFEEKRRPANLVSLQIESRSASDQQKPHSVARTAQPPPRRATQPVPAHPQQVQPVTPPLPFIALSKEDFAAADISHLPKADSASSASGNGDSHAAYGPGEGPGGAKLYNVAWYREPTDAELAPYLAHSHADGGWATIACRMIEHYHVEDCQELDESPPGSGLSRALREAAWQFLVRPPSINGKPMLGTWVRIKFTLSARHSSEPDDSLPGADQGQ